MKRFKITGRVALSVPFSWVGALDEDEQEMLDDFERIAGSVVVEEAIQKAIIDGWFEVDPNEIEIYDAKEVPSEGGAS